MRYLLVAVLALSGVISLATTAAAQVTEVVTAQTQRTIGYDQSWQESNNESDTETQLEFVTLEHVDGGVVGFVFSVQQLDNTQVRDAILDGARESSEAYTVIDSGEYDNTAYELAHFKSGDTKIGVFVLAVNSPAGTTATMVTGPVDSFKDVIGRVQAGVTLDGNQVLRGVDGASLQTQLQVTQASSVTTTADLPETTSNSTETGGSTTDSAASGEFTSPTWGYTVAHDSSWQVSNEAITEYDLIKFDPLVLVGIQGIENVGFTGPDFELALTETFIESLGPGGELIGVYSNQTSAVFVGVNAEGMVLIQEIIAVSPTVAVIVTAVSDGSADMQTVFTHLRSISISGIPLLSPVG